MIGSRKDLGGGMADATPPIAAGSNEMVERVAIAIFVSWYEGSDCEPVSFYTDCDDVLANDYRRIARAAIQAMREPTEGMMEEADYIVPIARGTESYRFFPVPEKIYRAMIDAALIGGPPPTEDDLKT